MMTVEQKIADAGQALGFVAVGFGAVGPSQTQDKFAGWLARGCHADMEYLPRNAAVRADPRKIAPWARTVIATAVRYPVNRTPGGGISTYAQGSDYHEVMHEKLLQLAAVVRRECKVAQVKACADATPLPEREWAARAGLGWIGRQGHVISSRFGACLLLGELLVDAALVPSAPVKEACGQCRRCLEACPTHAIGEDRQVDARRCVSYLTIEHRGDIPEDVRPLMGKAVFGCDFCTAVCPWNGHGETKVLKDFSPRATPTLEGFLRMQETEFQVRFRHTPLFRTGIDRLQRNAAIALGNTGSEAALPALREAMASRPPLVQHHAAWAVARIQARG